MRGFDEVIFGLLPEVIFGEEEAFNEPPKRLSRKEETGYYLR
jgi:hypothetical protein